MNRYRRPWVFVLVGILFNIGSAVITHYFIGINNDQIHQIESAVNNKQVLIESLWQSKTELERKNEFILLYLSHQEIRNQPNEVIEQFISNHLSMTIKNYQLDSESLRVDLSDENASQNILRINTLAQKRIVNTINESYFEKVDLQKSQHPLEKDNSFLLTLAIFMQITGLILVLARDLKFN